MPKPFSVITINYNNLKGLRRTFESVAGQTARADIEFVVVDGGSSDGSVEYLNSRQSEMDIFVSEKDKGIYDAMNKGLHLATGNYVWFVNSGDAIFEKETAQKLLPLTASQPDILFGDTMFIDDNGKELGLISRLKPQTLPKVLDKNSFRFGMTVCHQAFLAKRDICVDYDLQYRQAADIDWILKLLAKNPVSLRANHVLARFETGGSSSTNEKKAWKERYAVLSSHYGAAGNFLAHIWIVLRRILFNTGIWKPSYE